MKSWVDLVALNVVTHQLQVKRRTGKVCRPETDVLPLCTTTKESARNHILYLLTLTLDVLETVQPTGQQAVELE